MDGVDPDTLLEWLQTGAGEERDLQLMALEQLCMLLLMSDNIDRCFESCPPRTFLPALGKIFLDETAPENILEVTARAITYYLDVSNECTRRITQVEGAVKAISNRLVVADLTDRTSKDLAEQCVKLLEHICQREASAVYDAGGLQSMLHLICLNDQHIHKDTMHSAMTVVTRLCSKVEPQDANLLKCSSDLGALLSHDDAKISECALRCFAALTDRFIRKQLDPVELATPSNLVEHLLHLLNSLVPNSSLPIKVKSTGPQTGDTQPTGGIHAANRTPAFISIVLSLLSNLCRGSSAVTEQVIRSPLLVPAVKAVLSSKDERCVMDSLRLADLLIILLCEGRVALPKSSGSVAGTPSSASAESGASGFDKAHRHLIDAIRQRDTDALIDAVENGTVDPNFIDDVGQTLLNWCAAFGTSDMVIYLCDKGADPNKGQRSSSLHYAACFGRPEVVKILLQHGANPDLHDEEGRTALDKARERNDEGHQQVAQLLESPSSYMTIERSSKAKPAPSNPDNRGSAKSAVESLKTTGASEILSKIPMQPPENEVDMELAKRILQQLVPVFCTIFQNSLVGTVRRSTLALIRKCIYYISNEGIQQLLDHSSQRKLSQSSHTDQTQILSPLNKTTNGDFVESLMGVLLAVFNQEENQDVEGKEQALLVMKSLLQKDTEFWLEQLIRLGVYEKVENLANNVEVAPGLVQPNAALTNTECAALEAETLREHDNMSTISSQSFQSLSIGGLEDGTLSQTLSDSTTANRSEDRSATSTPSLSIKSDVESVSSSFPHSRGTRESSNERLQMLNIPHMESDDTATAACSQINTPSPTVELEHHHSSPQPTSSGSTNSASTKVSSQFASVRADLVEAATAVAQALGVQIVDDSRSTVAAAASSSSTTAKSGSSEKGKKNSDDAWKLACGISYKWNDWRLIRTRDSLFVWCDAVAIEFSDGSNGWLRFLLDGRLQTLYSSGSPESGADNADNRAEFIAKIQKAKQAVPAGNQIKTIFSVPRSSRKIESGNWQICSTEAGTLVIHNKEGSQQKTVIKEDLPGFVFESKHSRQQFTAESTLGLDFVTGWAARGGGRRLRFKAEAQRQKIHDLAKELWDTYLKEAKTKPRDALIELKSAAGNIRRLVEVIRDGENGGESDKKDGEWTTAVNELQKTLTQVRDAISNERLLSTFEVSISDVVPALLQLVKVAVEDGSRAIVKCFTETFSEARHLSYLIRKIVLVLEACERFPQNLYDTPGGSPFGMQLLTRRIRFRLEQANPEADSQKLFLNRTNRLMKAEPLATVGSLRQFLLGMMAKKWHDYARPDLTFVREIKALKSKAEKLVLEYDSDFDTNGLIWYLGTNGKTTDQWVNPALVKVINVCCSDGAKQPYGQPEDIFSREVTSINCHTSDSVDSNFTMDLGVLIFPAAYTLRHAQGYGRSALRNWLLQGSKDNHVWEMLLAHSDDQSLNEPGSTATWPIATEPGQGPYRYLRVAQNGKNSSSITHYLSLSGFEVYGTVVDVIDTELKPLEAPPMLQPASRGKSQHSSPITSSSLPPSSSSSKKQSRKNATSSPGGFGKDSSLSTSGTESKGSTLSNLHYSRPPTAASLRLVRKQQKAEKAAALAAATAHHDTATTPPLSHSGHKAAKGAVHNEGLLQAAAAATEDEIFKQLPGGANNNKLRILRYRRTGRTSLPTPSSITSPKPTPGSAAVKGDLVVNTSSHSQADETSNNIALTSADNTPTPTSSQAIQSSSTDSIPKIQCTPIKSTIPTHTPLRVGQRVQTASDWTWANQHNGGKGTVVSVSSTPTKKPLLGGDFGWVDVQWDYDGSVNSYRYGHQGKFDVEVVDSESSSEAIGVLGSCQRGKNLRQMRQLGSNNSSLGEKFFQEVPAKREKGSGKKSAAVESATALLAKMEEGEEVSIEVKNYNLMSSQESSQQLVNLDTDLSESGAKGLSSSTGGQASSISQQKSMSTTNLFDERQKPKGYTVASTNQAASAESLQHQTPSLENLLARSKFYGDRIPEVVGSDGEQTPSSATPEPRPFGSETVCLSSEQLDGSSQSMNTPTSNNTIQTSVAASTFGGGSQPVLSLSSKHQNSHQLLGTSQSAVSLEKDHPHHPHPGTNPPKRSSNSKNLSASEPDLAGPALPSVRQQRQRSFVPASSLMEDPMLFMEEDEEEETGTPEEGQPVIDEPEEINGVLVERAGPNLALPKARTSINSSASRFLSDIVDVECMDQFINSQEFYGGLVDAYSEMLMASGAEGGEVPENVQDVEQAFLSNYMGNALLQDLVSEGNSSSQSTPSAAHSALQQLSSTTNNDDSITSSSSSNAQSRRQLSNLGMGLRLKLGNYADVLRGMMHQVMDSSGIIGSFDADELENEIYEDEFQAHQNLIENNCEGSDEVVGFEQACFATPGGGSRVVGSGQAGMSSASIAFQNQVESLASAAAALRRQFSNTSSGSATGSRAAGAFGTGSNIAEGAEPKLSWRQIFMGEEGRFEGGEETGGNNNGDDRANSGSRNFKKTSRVWDDDFVLRRQLEALIPAFDPRPGRTNVNQTQEVELTNEPAENVPSVYTRKGSTMVRQSSLAAAGAASKLRIYLKGPNLANIQDQTVELSNDNASIFYYIQELMNATEWGQKAAEKQKRVWEPTYTLIYENPEGANPISIQLNKTKLDNQAKEHVDGLVRQSLDLIQMLHSLADKSQIALPKEVFHSCKLTQKLTQSLTDPLIVSAKALPDWCNHLVFNYPCLFSVDTRSMHLHATAFGTSRAIVWLQNRRDQMLEQNRSSSTSSGSSNLAGSRREDHYPEYRIGRIKHERIKVHRNDDLLLENAIRVMNFHAIRKSVLEIEYFGEEGTGLGPTLEFYALVAAEFQRKSLGMWLCDDSDENQTLLEAHELDLGEGAKAPGYYVRRSGGLFPAFLPQGTEETKKVASLFRIFGIFLAKVLQDNRLVDIPLSTTFLRLMLSLEVTKSGDSCNGYFSPLTTIEDLAQIHPLKANFLSSLQQFILQKQAIENDSRLAESAKKEALAGLKLKLGGQEHGECSVEDLGLSFVLNPPSSIFAYEEIELVEEGAKVDVTGENVENYVQKCLDFYLNTGIREQVTAFRQGFDLVFPLSSLTAFSPSEVQVLLSGEQCPQWSREDILKYTEPKLGYSRDSAGFLHFVDVLVDMNAAERKGFLQFTTGCSSLPPGGLANLHPRLTVVRKVGSGDGSFPSVNTCVHYLKLPEYSSVEILRERLLAATFEKGFHLN